MAKSTDLRQSRLWQDSLAHVTVFEGVPGDCMKWLQFAKLKLQFMLHNSPGPLSATYQPADGVKVRVDSRPNRIWIKTGTSVIYVTVMDRDSALTSGFTYSAPPYQIWRGRRYYASKDTLLTANDEYAGGALYDGIAGYGGSWYDQDNRNAISWTEDTIYHTLYIGGRYSTITLDAGVRIHAAALIPVATLELAYPSDPDIGNFKYGIVVLAVHNSTRACTLQMYGAYISTPFDGVFSNKLLGSVALGNRVGQLTGFTADARKIGLLKPATDANGFTQTIDEIAFAADYLSYTVTRILDEVAVHIKKVLTFTVPDAAHHSSGTLVHTRESGDPYIHYLQADGLSFCALRQDLTSIASSSTISVTLAGESSVRSGSYDETYSGTATWYFDMCTVSSSGVSNIRTLPSETASAAESNSSSFDVSTGIRTVAVTLSGDAKFNVVWAFSAGRDFALYLNTSTANAATINASHDGTTYTGAGEVGTLTYANDVILKKSASSVSTHTASASETFTNAPYEGFFTSYLDIFADDSAFGGTRTLYYVVSDVINKNGGTYMRVGFSAAKINLHATTDKVLLTSQTIQGDSGTTTDLSYIVNLDEGVPAPYTKLLYRLDDAPSATQPAPIATAHRPY